MTVDEQIYLRDADDVRNVTHAKLSYRMHSLHTGNLGAFFVTKSNNPEALV